MVGVLCMVLGQLSTPPLVPLDDVVEPPPPATAPSVSDAPRTARLVPIDDAPTGQELFARAALSPLLVASISVLSVPLALYVGAVMGVVIDPIQGESVGAGIGAIVGGALGFVAGSAIASTLFSKDKNALVRALPWAGAAAALTTLGVCLVIFVPAVGLGALPFVIAGGVALAVAVPLVAEAMRPRAPTGVTVASF